MTRFYPVYVRRSDGKLEVITKAKRKEANEPTPEQLDQKPDSNGVSDYYRQVGIDESKHLDWRRKLGGMLARELEWKGKSAQAGSEVGYMLVAFPENYRLYEHVKKTEKDGKTEVKSKTHAGGGNDRQDAYLYGHPAGRKKRYRSPNDFFPHLLWLCTDESGDPDNCGCKICSPDDLEDIMPGAKSKSPAVKVEAAASPANAARPSSASGGTKIKQEPDPTAPIPVKPRQGSTGALRPTVLVGSSHPDQTIDMQYNTFFYRPGELVWYERGQAWGLGVVVRRWRSSNHPNYVIQPLSHPYGKNPTVTKMRDGDLRPWLAWSVPKYTTDSLNKMNDPPRFDSIDWTAMLHKKYGNGDAEVDGSILAAKAVDSSYTPFQQIRSMQREPGVTDVLYNGMFLGAEKIWVNDVVRLQVNTEILVVHSVVVRKNTNSSEMQRTPFLQGDIYELTRIHQTNPDTPTSASPDNNPHLPSRLTEDLAVRNRITITTKAYASYWKLKASNTRVNFDEVKGRWYEASLALPILSTRTLEEVARAQEVGEAAAWMNGRGDCLNANREGMPRVPRVNIFKTSRIEAFGGAVPEGTVIRDGVEPPANENVDPALAGVMAGQEELVIDPRFDTGADVSSDTIQVSRPEQMSNGGELDEFMNLDGMDEQGGEGMPGFGQHGYY